MNYDNLFSKIYRLWGITPTEDEMNEILSLLDENTASVSDGGTEFSDLHDVSDRNAERSGTTKEPGPSVDHIKSVWAALALEMLLYHLLSKVQ